MKNQKKKRIFSIARLSKSFGFAFKGIYYVARSEPNFRIHLLFAIIAVAMGFAFGIERWEWCMVVFAIAFVLSAEAFNTALERLTDLASPDIHPLAEQSKDAAAGAVLLAAIGAALVGLVVFLPRVWGLF